MILQMLLVLLKLSIALAAPLQFPLLQPMPGTIQQQQLALQEQLLAIQQFHAMQRFNPLPSPVAINPQPLLLLLPNDQSNLEQDNRYNKLNENLIKGNKPSQAIEDDDTDSIVIDAEPPDTINRVDEKNGPMKAILLVPNARFSLGDFISSIPFLPIEINVPDSISWIYNGISGIISGIGQSWPFSRPQSSEKQSENMKTVWKDLKMRKLLPIIVVPLGQPMLPMQV